MVTTNPQTAVDRPPLDNPLDINPDLQSGPFRVLVVDDNVDSARSMAMLLELEGYDVECAFDGEEALRLAASLRPHVVMLDLGLPLLNGYDVARRLRQDPTMARGGVPLLLMAVSGYGRERDRAQARDAGFDLHLTKPADPELVLQLLARHRARTQS